MNEHVESRFLSVNNPAIATPELERAIEKMLSRLSDAVKDPVELQVENIENQIDELVYDERRFQFETDPECFVEKVYHSFLHRQPDFMANRIWVRRLSSGWPRTLLLVRIRFSPEGRAKNVRLRGHLGWIVADLLGAIPVIGRFIYIVHILWSLPRWYTRNRNEAMRLRYLEKRYDHTRCLLRRLNTGILELEQAICSLESEQRLRCIRQCRKLRHKVEALEKMTDSLGQA